MNLFENFLEKTKEIGQIVSLSHSIAFVSGLPGLKIGETIITEKGEVGIAYNLEKNLAEILIINPENIKIKEKVVRTEKSFEIMVSKGMLGRIVNPFSQAIDGLGPIKGEKEFREIERNAPLFSERARIKKPMETGVIMVDFLVPIGYGQRELIIGDAKTGKTTFLLQTIVSQAKKGTICIYVGIGKKDTAVKSVEEYLKNQGVFEKVIIIHTAADDSPTLIYLAPYSGMTIAEYFRDLGERVLIIFDDFSTHAKIYREISLLLKKLPGRSSYPGDIFHIHAKLLERAGNLKKNGEEASITALPVAETLEGDLSGYIQTNLMAMTDGHIFFDIDEFRKGRRPAINTFLSVSRVGNQTKSPIEKILAAWLRKKIAEYQDALELAQFGTELPTKTLEVLDLGKKIELLLNQEPQTILPQKLQLLMVGLLYSEFWKSKPLEEMRIEMLKLIEKYNEGKIPEIGEKIEEIKNLEHLHFLIKEIIPQIEKTI